MHITKRKFLSPTWQRTIFLFICLFTSSLVFSDSQLHYESALSAYKAERFDESMIHLKNALHESPNNLPSKVLMGQLLTKQGQYKTAEIEFSEAIRQGADVSLFSTSWGLALIKLKEFEKVIEYTGFKSFPSIQLKDWLRLRADACMQAKNYECATESYAYLGRISKDRAEELNGLANVALTLKNYPEALSFLTQAGEIDPKNSVTWQLKGLVARQQNDLTNALTYLEKAFQLNPDDPYILRHLADVYLASSNQEAAKKTVNTILTASPNDPFAILVNSWLQQGTSLAPDAEEKFNELAAKIKNYPSQLVEQDQPLLFLRALIQFREKNYDFAIRDFTALRRFDRSDLSPIIYLAKSYIALNKEKKAMALLEENQAMLEALPDTLIMLGDLYINNDKNFKALSLIETLKEKYADNIQVQLLETKLLIARGKTQEGLESLDNLTAQAPDNQAILLVHSILNLQANRFAKANASISQLLSFKPNDPVSLNIKGAILIKLNQVTEAQSYLNKALTINPNFTSANYNLATTWYLLGDLTKAEQLVANILAKSPNYPAALLLLAKMQLKQNDADQALQNYRKVLLSDKNNVAALEGLTTIYVSRKEYKSALLQLNRLTSRDQENPKYVIQKAQIYIAQNDTLSSKRTLQELQRLASNNAALMIALHKLQMLVGDVEAATHSLVSAQKLQPDSLKLALQLSEFLLNEHKTDAAESQLNQLSSKYPQQAEVSFLLGRLAEQQGKLTKANQLYLTTLDLDDSYELALAKLYALTTKGIASAPFKDKLDQIVANNPERFFPRNLLAQYLFYQKNYEQAAQEYEQLLQHAELNEPQGILNRLAYIYMTSDLDKSLEYALQSYALDDKNPKTLTIYGWLLTQKSQPKEGLELLRRAYSRDQQNPALHYYIAVSLNMLGLVNEAKSELAALFDKNQNFEEKAAAEALYAKLIKQ
ncbi:XrtA/PEP-CTERM system TPR-repeat protein PrsT [Paraglaciecola sp. 2405UD69-4]|uniref:XrtA/PEP-CTERM system TPR-repeat protein PrsT n=1 Tax=Paraglaciecola sp. 2405UD69-4 TaxID=3391836 RepID=UPI0039C8EA4B